MQSTKANTKTPAISSALVPGARKAAAVSSSSKLATSTVAPPEFEEVSPPAPKPLEGWGLQDPSSDEEEEEEAGAVVAQAKKSAAAKKGSKVKGRAPSKDKYLLSRPTPAADQPDDDPEGEDPFMSGGPAAAAAGFVDVPSSFDPFADAARAEDAAAPKDVVHLRVQQRNGRKTLTTVQGLCPDFNYARILRDLKRELCCSGIVVEDEELGKIIQLQGDHRKKVGAFIVEAGMARKDNVKVHGF